MSSISSNANRLIVTGHVLPITVTFYGLRIGKDGRGLGIFFSLPTHNDTISTFGAALAACQCEASMALFPIFAPLI